MKDIRPAVAEALARHIARHPEDGRWLEIGLDRSGRARQYDLRRAADSRVLVFLRFV